MSGPSVESSIRLVLADDREATRSSLAALLSTYEGIRVLGSAADGRELIALVERLLPDLVLLDGRMPVMDGLEATRVIKQRHPDIAVVIHSLYGSLEADALRAGADAFLLKGCSSERLVATVQAAVAGRHRYRKNLTGGGHYE